jgi:hypothetical protein
MGAGDFCCHNSLSNIANPIKKHPIMNATPSIIFASSPL